MSGMQRSSSEVGGRVSHRVAFWAGTWARQVTRRRLPNGTMRSGQGQGWLYVKAASRNGLAAEIRAGARAREGGSCLTLLEPYLFGTTQPGPGYVNPDGDTLLPFEYSGCTQNAPFDI